MANYMIIKAQPNIVLSRHRTIIRSRNDLIKYLLYMIYEANIQMLHEDVLFDETNFVERITHDAEEILRDLYDILLGEKKVEAHKKKISGMYP